MLVTRYSQQIASVLFSLKEMLVPQGIRRQLVSASLISLIPLDRETLLHL